ncbi:MAG TPA: ROK family protein, partial [Blastocatellia bacterium]
MKVTSKAQPQSEAAPAVIAIQFDHSKITAALVNEHGRAVEEREISTPRRTTRAAAVEAAKMIVALAVSQSRARSPINAVGISVAGLVDPSTGRVSIPELKGWNRVALRQMLDEELKGAGIDIRVPPDERRARAKYADSAFPAMVINSRAAAMAAGEAWIGA